MQCSNSSTVTKVVLLGFQNLHTLNSLCFLVLLIIFCVTVCGNLLIIVVVSYSRFLHSPMYFFLTQLSTLDILLTSTIVPTMLRVMLYKGSVLSFMGCLAQFYFFAASESLECLLLTVMSYDRYQAICNPLHYASIMNFTFCIKAVLLCWLIMSTIVFILSVSMSHLWFCGPNIIDHFFCDFYPIVELSCSDTFFMKIEGMVVAVPLVLCPFVVIMVSYVYIIITILKIPSVTGRRKTFSTCSSHLSVVCLYYGSIISIYLFQYTESAKKIISLFYTVVSPLLNPLIYSPNNRDIKLAFRKFLREVSSALQMK